MESKWKFAALLAIGISIGLISGSFIHSVNNFVRETERINKVVQKVSDDLLHPIRDWKLDKAVVWDNHLWIKTSFLKTNDCGPPIDFQVNFREEGDLTFELPEKLEIINEHGRVTSPGSLPVLPLYQELRWWKVSPKFNNGEFFIFTEHSCPIDSNNPDSVTKDVRKTFGPFKIQDAQEQDPFEKKKKE
jgi:hypothetical protein